MNHYPTFEFQRPTGDFVTCYVDDAQLNDDWLIPEEPAARNAAASDASA